MSEQFLKSNFMVVYGIYDKLHRFSIGFFGGRGVGYFEKVQWPLCVKESMCVQSLTNGLHLTSLMYINGND